MADAPPTPAAEEQCRLYSLGRLAWAVLAGFRGESLALRAGNLTFITTTSLVPMAALILSLVHVLNEGRVEQLVMKFFDDILAPAGKSQMVDGFRHFMHSAPSRTIGSVSFFFLAVSSSVLLRHLDASLNEVWAVRRRRPFPVSAVLYAGILVFGPLLMGLSLAGTDGIRRLILWLELPFSGQALTVGAMLSAGLVFALLYKLAPHAPVPWRAALIGGGIAGFAWEVARHVYGGIASFFYASNPLYGSIGIAPLFLMWIYVAWTIILTGARLAYAIEHADFHDEFRDLLAHPRSQEIIATRVATLVAAAKLAGRPGPTTKALAAALQLPEQRLADVVFLLEEAGLLISTRAGELHPAADPARLTVADLSLAVGGTVVPAAALTGPRAGPFAGAARLFAEVDDATSGKLKGISWAELVAQGGPLEEKR